MRATRKRPRSGDTPNIPDQENYSLLKQSAGGTTKSLRRQHLLTPTPTEQKTLALRLCFIGSMVIAAIVTASVTYTVTKKLEVEAAIHLYESIASSALFQAQAISRRKQQGAEVLSSIMGHAFPSASMWPMVGLRGFHTIARKVAQLDSSVGHGFMPIVRPDQVEEFEDHAAKIYKEFQYPQSAGWSEFGFGVWGKDDNSTYSDGRFHDSSGNTTYGSNESFVAPFLQHSNTMTDPNLLLMNVHQGAARGQVMDSIIACAEAAKRATPEGALEVEPHSCGSVTDFTETYVKVSSSSIFFHPVFPADDPFKVVAFIGTSMNWKEVLDRVVPDYVDGLDCVICNDIGVCHTYVIYRGVPEEVGPGDWHDPQFDGYGHSVALNDDDSTGATASRLYSLTVYPTNRMFDEFRSRNPAYMSVGFLVVIFTCGAIFLVYDYFMKRQSQERKKILEVKRRFVRVISHEIRTPLNVVCMGLELLQAEIRHVLELADTSIIGAFNRSALTAKGVESGLKHFFEPINNSESNSSSEDKPTTKHKEWLDLSEDILENALNAVSVLNDLLSFDKIESGTFKLEVGMVDLWSLMVKTVSEFHVQARNRKISLNIKSDADENDEEAALGLKHGLKQLRAMGDDVRLTQVIRNLISNAIKFSPEGGAITVKAKYVPFGLPEAKILELTSSSGYDHEDSDDENCFDVDNSDRSDATVNCGARAGSVRISVEDHGAGLSEEQLQQLFSEGVQFNAKKLQAGGGSGLGLCITKEIVEQHYGTIEAHSEGMGCGSTFTVELPLYEGLTQLEEEPDEEDGEDPSASKAGNSRQCGHDCTSGKRVSDSGCDKSGGGSDTTEATASSSCDHHHVLVVDDVVSNTKLLVRLLERHGHTCGVARNGQEALDVFVANDQNGSPFDTVLMDYEMPVLNGPDATKKLREMGCSAFIFGVTGNVLAEDVAFFKSSGADHVLPKPVNIAAIDACWSSLPPRGKFTDR